MVTTQKRMYLRPPISYYGGKQLLLKHILPLIPTHLKYVESFLGGGAVFWTKAPSDIEVINDMDGFVANFYKVFKKDLEGLKRLIGTTPYSRSRHDDAIIMRQYPHLFSDLERAWSFYYMANTSLYSILENAMNTPSKDLKPVVTFNNKVNLLEDSRYLERLKNAFIESRDALYVIQRHDSENTFHFIDPPYFNANMGHYAGYSENDFRQLLEVVSHLKGKFLLTCYPCDLIVEYAIKNGWHIDYIEMSLNAGSKGKKKVECLIRNYIL
jgi:DNA adenine methylase